MPDQILDPALMEEGIGFEPTRLSGPPGPESGAVKRQGKATLRYRRKIFIGSHKPVLFVPQI